MALVGTVLALLLGGAGSASAHAALSSSDPEDRSVVTTAPNQVTLTFTEAVSFPDGSLRVLSPDNERVNPLPPERPDGKANAARVALPGKLAQGTYTVAWRVVSADSHTISGAFTFSIGKPSETKAVLPSASPDDSAANRLYGLFRYLAYGGLALLIGVAAFTFICPAGTAQRPVARLMVTGWTTLTVATVVLLLLRGPYETGRALTSVFDLSLLGDTMTGRTGKALVARLVLLAATAVLLKRMTARSERRQERTPRRELAIRVVGALLAVGLAVTWAATQHASAGTQVPLAIAVAVLHLLAMAVWLGGLTALVVGMYRLPPADRLPASDINRFSTVAFTAVAVLLATGVYQSWRQVGSWAALTDTSYGRTLTLKVAAVVLLLWAASFSRRRTARLLHRPRPALEAVPVPVPERVRLAQTVGGPASPDIAVGGVTTVDSPAPDARAGDANPPGFESDLYWRRLRRSATTEAVLGVVVLAITTVLTGTQPSRAAEGTATAAAAQEPLAKVIMVPFDMGSPNNRGKVLITLAPGRVGENTVEAVVYAADGGISAVPELRLTLTQREDRIGPLDAGLKDRKGYWASYDLRLPMPGVWTMNITVRTTDVDQVTLQKSIRIAPPST
ncbi:copper resistance protein CopC [Streptomyces sp. P9(2023)]|nr:copper resistance protein CopC [Streptomyces sp. P9(2023)]